MLTDYHVVLTVYDPVENRVTNFSSSDKLEKLIKKENLIEERFVLEDVSCLIHNSNLYFYLSITTFSSRRMRTLQTDSTILFLRKD